MRWVPIAARSLGLGVCLSAIAPAPVSASELASPGCPRAHCDAANSDLTMMPVPGAPAELAWVAEELAGEKVGSLSGLGCSSDGIMAVCTFAGATDSVVAYDFDGNRLWSSGSVLSAFAFTSAPLILPNGDVVVADHVRVVKFDSAGNVLWNTVRPFAGIVISPVLTADDVIVLATRRGPVTVVDNATGTVLDDLFLKSGAGDPGFFDTSTTPAVSGNRVYVAMQHQTFGAVDLDQPGRLVALDIDRDRPVPIAVAWSYEMLPPSTSSPLLIGDVVYFSGNREVGVLGKRPHIFAVRDTGPGPQELWQVQPSSPAVASFAQDPRPEGGFWHQQWNRTWILRRALADGTIVQAINIDALIDEPGDHRPLSAMTVAQGPEGPVLILSARDPVGSTFVVAVDVVNERLVWKVKVSDIGGIAAAGQFPLLDDGPDDATRVVFTLSRGGARAIGTVAPP